MLYTSSTKRKAHIGQIPQTLQNLHDFTAKFVLLRRFLCKMDAICTNKLNVYDEYIQVAQLQKTAHFAMI